MRTRISAALNGISLDSLDDSIVIQSVEPQAPSWNLNANSRGARNGQKYVSTEKRYRDVIVKFAIKEPRDYTWRETVIQKVAAWAEEGGDFSYSARPGMILRVKCSSLMTVGAINEWTTVYQITFRAFNIPCWINEQADSATASGSSASPTIRITANGGGKLRVTARNSSGSACDTVTVRANGYTIQLTGLGLGNGETLEMDYTAEDIQRIRIKNSSGAYRTALAARTAGSHDDIWLKAGANTISASAGRALAWTFSCYGRWIG